VIIIGIVGIIDIMDIVGLLALLGIVGLLALLGIVGLPALLPVPPRREGMAPRARDWRRAPVDRSSQGFSP
jgi:hypothetical protein